MSEQSAETDTGQPLIDHLIELRSRILRSALSIIVVFLPLFYFANDIYTYLSKPLRAFLPEGSTMIATEVASPFLTPFKLTLVLAIFIAMPYILHQLWSFIAPGLYSNEKRIAMPLLASSIVLFYTGIAFAFYVVFPLVFGFFTSVAPEGVTIMTDINRYLDFVLKLFFAFGLAFEIPIATVLLVWTGATTVENLRHKRPYIIVGCFVIGMLLTPPDVISQILLAVPMWFLYEGGIVFFRNLFARKKPNLQMKPREHPWVQPTMKDSMASERIEELTRKLSLQHLEGEAGLYSIVCISDLQVDAEDGRSPASNAIYFMLTRDEPQNYLHWLYSDDYQTLIEGGPADYYLFYPDGSVEKHTLGNDLLNSEALFVPVPAGTMKAIVLHDEASYLLVSSVVTPAWNLQRVKVGAGSEFINKYSGKAEWATVEFLKYLIGPNFKQQ